MSEKSVEDRIVETEAEMARLQDRRAELETKRARKILAEMEAFDELSSEERRAVKEGAPDKWREMMKRKREAGERTLQKTNPRGGLL